MTADFYGDGRTDLFKFVSSTYPGDTDCSAGASSIIFSQSYTNIVFEDAVCLPTLKSDRMKLNFFDTNADTSDDIIFQLGSQSELSCMPGTGGSLISNRNGTFSDAHCFDFASHKDYVSFTPMDIDGDGLMDLFMQIDPGYANSTECPSSGAGAIYMSNGNGTFAFSSCTSFNVNPSKVKVYTGHLNRDSQHDLIVQTNPSVNSTCQTGQAAVYLSNGDGTFNFTSCIGHLYYDSVKITMTDVNGDTFSDIITQVNISVAGSVSAPCYSVGGGAIFLSHGNGTFAEPICLPFNATVNHANLAIADVNFDRKMDIIAHVDLDYTGSSCSVGQSAIYLASNNGTFVPPACIGSNIPRNATRLIMADFHGDGGSEMLIQVFSSYSNSDCIGGHGGVYRLDGSLMFWGD
jgi:hypothetical protein